MSQSGPMQTTSLAMRLVLFVTGSIFATALVLSWIAVESSRDHLRNHLVDTYTQHLDGLAGQTRAWFAANQAALAGVEPESESPAALAAELSSQASNIRALAILDEAGNVVSRTQEIAFSRIPAVESSHMTALPDRMDRKQMVIWRPLETPTGAGRYLVAVLDTQALHEIVNRPRPHQRARVSLFTSQGIGLVGPPPQRAIRQEPGQFRARHDFSSLPLSLAVAVPYQDAFAPLESLISRILFSDLALITCFSLLAYFETRRIMAPIRRLTEGARLISHGDEGQAIRVPDSQDEISELTRIFNEMMDRVRRNKHEVEVANEQLRQRNEQLQTANEVLNQLSITDGLTKLHNHRYFQDQLTREISLASRAQAPLSMLLIDLDDFKTLNDQQGHIVGDDTLTRVSHTMNASVRSTDVLARYGGEEFVVLAPNTDLVGATHLAEKLRRAVEHSHETADASGKRELPVTVSIGVAQFAEDRRLFFETADRALYRAKAEGKNCVITTDA
ncbi:MAG: diguanylate cyclase [Deltaproteobacteria bacterium]|nr:diguanylate cyclase [Deltaproteobacteria bacterium]